MEALLLYLMPVVLILSGIVIAVAFFFYAFSRVGQKKRKSPFVGQFLRSPGHSVGEQLDDVRVDLLGYWMALAMLPMLLVSLPLLQAAIQGQPASEIRWHVHIVAALMGIPLLGLKTIRAIRRFTRLRLGHEGEMAVGQELNQLMQSGFRVYHDFPAEGFNIDHIVIGRTGVFAVETKARAKPDTGDGRKDARLEYDGQVLRFPEWVETAPIEQATRQAAWLSKWLSSAVGERVPVVAAVAVPGWFINQVKPAQVLVYNGKRPDKVFPGYAGRSLEPAMIQRIAHQVEAKCRDVAPRAYKKTQAKT